MLTPAQAAAIATSALVRPAVPTALVAPPPAEASSPYRTVVEADEDDDPREAQREVDRRSPGFATAIDLEHEPGARSSDALPELLARAPGTTVRSFGGLGQFAAVSLRGSSPQQVALFLDGVPLNSSVAGLVDVGSLPLEGLHRIEVYRGYVPIAYGSAAIGGAIDLVGAPAWRRRGLSLRAGYGSFGAREGGVSMGGPLSGSGRTAGMLSIGYAGATGDFPFLYDGGTPALAGDDVDRRRRNDDYDRIAVHARLDHRRGPWRIAVQPLVQLKTQGIPGPASAESQQVRLGTLVARTVVTARRHELLGPGGRLEWRLGLGALHQIYRDPAGEVGLAVDDQRQVGVDLYLSPRLRLPLWHGAFLGLSADQRVEHLDVDQRAPTVGSTGDARRTRLWWGAAMELEQFVGDRLRVVPALRVDALDSRFAVPPGAGEQDDAGRDASTVGLGPRVGARLRLVPGLELRASGGRYFRPPTLPELFGNQGYLVGNEGLRPERGQAVDGGLVLDRDLAGLMLYAAIAGFATWSEDLVQWVSAGAVARPTNVEGARLRGMESTLALVPRRPWLTLHTNYTFLDTRNDSPDPTVHDQPLPGRPRHELFVRGTAGRGFWVGRVWTEPRVLYTLELSAGTTLDTAGRLRFPPRAVQGLGAELHLGQRVHLGVEVRNLLDLRTTTVMLRDVDGVRPRPAGFQDFLGYPLPGRSVWGSVRVELEGRRR
ncbi:MAG: TonB-dependent receptor [Myxococcales bacterium]|nr:TonB-dependent receptor [Myxococcales bacterium]